MKMRLVRTITVAGFSADADPNVSQPSSGTFVMTGATGDALKSSDTNIEGHRFAFRFVTAATPPVDVPGASCDFQTYALDDGATAAYGRQVWNNMQAESAAPHGRLYPAPLKATLYPRVTALQNVGSAVNLEVWAEESTDVEG